MLLRVSLFAAAAVACAAAGAAGPPFCAVCANGGAPPMQNEVMHAACADAGATISAVLFASYGTPTGSCPSFSRGSCDASTSVSVVQAACVGRHECDVYPNTTTFADPCFGTAKVLAVTLTCSSGAGSAACGVLPPPPPPPPPANFSATVAVHWGAITANVLASPSIQVVSHHALWRSAPTHDQAFATLKQLGAQSVRFVPWVPYAQHGVGELMPPSHGGALCSRQNYAAGPQIEPETLDCGPFGGEIESVTFASFGKATGNCGAYARSASCDAANSSAVVAALCVGKKSCVVPTASGGAFGSPCDGAYLAVQLQCSNHSATIAYWNMTLPDQFMQDYWDGVDGDNSNALPNFSTQPTWLYSSDYSWNADPSQPWDYSRGSFTDCDNKLLEGYYARLYGYFATGSMVDEGGVTHTRPGGALNIRQIEVFNEVDYEHGYDVAGYTAAFDAVVRGVRSFDVDHKIRFVGMNLPNIDPADKVAEWAAYFLNASNHDPACVDALNSIGYHAYPTNGPYTPDPTSFRLMFDYVDAFIEGVNRIDAVIKAVSPSTVTYLDETGTDMDGVLGPGAPPGNSPRYWVAAAGYWCYMFVKAVNSSTTVRQVGASQLMDAPGQEPSVTLLDWSTGLGTARFWVVKLIGESIIADDVLTAADVSVTGGDADALFAVGFMTPDQSVKQVLLINKRNAFATVTVQCGGGAPCNCASLKTIDEFTGLQPARTDSCGAGPITLAPYATTVMLTE